MVPSVPTQPTHSADGGAAVLGHRSSRVQLLGCIERHLQLGSEVGILRPQRIALGHQQRHVNVRHDQSTVRRVGWRWGTAAQGLQLAAVARITCTVDCTGELSRLSRREAGDSRRSGERVNWHSLLLKDSTPYDVDECLGATI